MKSHVSKAQFEHALLFKFFEESNADGHPKPYHDLTKMFQMPVPPHRLKLALEALYADEFLTSSVTSSGWELYSISNLGLAVVESRLSQSGSFLSEYSSKGDRWLFADQATAYIPASDRMVDLGHNQAAVDQVDADLASAVKVLQESNEVGDLFGDDRQPAIDEIEGLRKMLTSARLRAEAFRSSAQSTLRWISEKGAGTVIAELAKIALKHILNWLS